MEEWLKSGKYLPRVLRDFHDQKEVFKAIHQAIAVEKHGYCKDVSWVAGQCYVIDIFLWYMARRGYTLQRARKVDAMAFRNLTDDVCEQTRLREESFIKAMNERGDYEII